MIRNIQSIMDANVKLKGRFYALHYIVSIIRGSSVLLRLASCRMDHILFICVGPPKVIEDVLEKPDLAIELKSLLDSGCWTSPSPDPLPDFSPQVKVLRSSVL